MIVAGNFALVCYVRVILGLPSLFDVLRKREHTRQSTLTLSFAVSNAPRVSSNCA